MRRIESKHDIPYPSHGVIVDVDGSYYVVTQVAPESFQLIAIYEDANRKTDTVYDMKSIKKLILEHPSVVCGHDEEVAEVYANLVTGKVTMPEKKKISLNGIKVTAEPTYIEIGCVKVTKAWINDFITLHEEAEKHGITVRDAYDLFISNKQKLGL